MYHSYVMGIDESIYTLEHQGFEINRDGGNFMVSFPKEKAEIWEEYISAHLEFEYWNEYLTENGAVFFQKIGVGQTAVSVFFVGQRV